MDAAAARSSTPSASAIASSTVSHVAQMVDGAVEVLARAARDAGAGDRVTVRKVGPRTGSPARKQEPVAISTLPALVDGALEPRHADLRAFVCAAPGGGFTVPPAGLARFAAVAGDLVVNSSQGGGGKDVWVVG